MSLILRKIISHKKKKKAFIKKKVLLKMDIDRRNHLGKRNRDINSLVLGRLE